MSDYKERMKVEIEELQSKITKIEAFIESDRFNELDEPNRDLLITQQCAMSAYFGILSIRCRVAE